MNAIAFVVLLALPGPQQCDSNMIPASSGTFVPSSTGGTTHTIPAIGYYRLAPCGCKHEEVKVGFLVHPVPQRRALIFPDREALELYLSQNKLPDDAVVLDIRKHKPITVVQEAIMDTVQPPTPPPEIKTKGYQVEFDK